MIWYFFGGVSFSTIIIIAAIRYCNYYCDEISNILNQLISKKPVIDSSYKCDSRLSKLVHQTNKITEMTGLDYQKAKEENDLVKRLISDLSHQLKTPLSNVMMYSDLIEACSGNYKKQMECITKLQQETRKMEWLLNTLFKMTRLETGVIDFQTEDLFIKETIMQGISAVFLKACEKQILIDMRVIKDCKLVHNRKWTVEAITNIMENAIKYSTAGTTITVNFEERELYSCIHFKDQGIGIEPSDYNNIFKRFYRGEKVKDCEGTGIGLYLARLIVTKEGGNITVKSELGRGSCFSVFLQNCKK